MGYSVTSNKSTYKVAAEANIKARDQIYIDSDGFAAPGAAPTSGLTGVVVGSAIEDVDNSTGLDGEKSVTVEHSCGETAFLLAGSGITAADAGKTCYVGSTPKTVSKTATNAIKSGTIQGVEDDGLVRVIFTL